MKFQNYRTIVKSKDAVRSRKVNTEKGREISIVKSRVRDSDLMRYLRELQRRGVIYLMPNKAPYIFEAYKSLKNNLYNDYTRKVTAWAKYVNWDAFRTDLRKFYRYHLHPELFETYMGYYDTKQFSLSPFESRPLVDSFLSYGVNNGKWDTEVLKLWTTEADDMISAMKWTDLHLEDFKKDVALIENSKQAWNELVLSNPMFGVLRHEATSGWPDYHPQTMEYIVKTVASAVDADPDYVISMYHRRHGYTRKYNQFNIPEITIKVRFVAGVEYVVKIKGLQFTWSFKRSKPEWCAYYRPWAQEIFEPLTIFLDGYDGFVFTSDQSLHDAHHDGSLMNRIKSRLYNNEKSPMPDHIKQNHEKEFKVCESPTVQVSPFEAIKSDKTISPSGSPMVPFYESVTTGADHRVCIAKQKREVDKEMIQIDDAFYATNRPIDLKQFSIDMGSYFGAEVSPTKTETMDKGFIVFLQVVVGKLYQQPKDLTFLVPIKTDDIFYKGFGPRRDHRLEDRERIRSSGINDVTYVTDSDFPKDSIQQSVERILGTLSSYGPQVPKELLDIHIDHLSGFRTNRSEFNPIWRRLVDFVKSDPVYVMGDYGFDPRFLLRYLSEVY